MSKKHHGGPGPVPPANRPQQFGGVPQGDDDAAQPHEAGTSGAAAQEQDPQRRLGDYTGAGEHSIQQPSALNDGTHHNK
ncbi:hypothetical protein [Gemmata sp.]|uniref:hypothetical protein n=1 Tax=Gemmata sp. TaxID=1914242 RepID=UPI003F722D01